MFDLTQLTPTELLKLQSSIIEELRSRRILRSSNNPVGDWAEYLYCTAFQWNQTGNSQAQVDAIGPDGKRYQIKGRRITPQNGSRQLSAIRDLDKNPFDFLAGVLFEADYSVMRAAIIPAKIVRRLSTPHDHTRSFTFQLRNRVWDAPGVRDVTEKLRAVAHIVR